MTDQKTPDQLPKDLIDDAEFVALMEAELRDDKATGAADELAQKRLWQRLEASTAAPLPQRKRMIWPWALVAAVLLALIPLFQNQESDQFKGGQNPSSANGVSLSVTVENDSYKISYSGSDEGFLALVSETEPFDVMWLRNGPSGSWTVPKSEVETQRVCAIAGRDITDVTRKLNLIRELKQLPEDAPCISFPQTAK